MKTALIVSLLTLASSLLPLAAHANSAQFAAAYGPGEGAQVHDGIG